MLPEQESWEPPKKNIVGYYMPIEENRSPPDLRPKIRKLIKALTTVLAALEILPAERSEKTRDCELNAATWSTWRDVSENLFRLREILRIDFLYQPETIYNNAVLTQECNQAINWLAVYVPKILDWMKAQQVRKQRKLQAFPEQFHEGLDLAHQRLSAVCLEKRPTSFKPDNPPEQCSMHKDGEALSGREGIDSLWLPNDLSDAAHAAQEGVYAALALIHAARDPNTTGDALSGLLRDLLRKANKARDRVKPLVPELVFAHKESKSTLPAIGKLPGKSACLLGAEFARNTVEAYTIQFESPDSWGSRLYLHNLSPEILSQIRRQLTSLPCPDGHLLRDLIYREVEIAAAQRLIARPPRSLAAGEDNTTTSGPNASVSTDYVEWTSADGPSQWAKLFGVSVSTLRRRFADGSIRHKKLSSKSYQIAIGDLPAKHQAKFRNGGNQIPR